MFYITGEGDRVSCFSCELEMCNWNKEDVPYNEHMREQPQCAFIKDITFQLDHRQMVGILIFFAIKSSCKNQEHFR